jgi:hypothetical protein
MHFFFVSTRRGSYFMTELLSAISAATRAAGHTAELVFDEFPRVPRDCIYVFIPHEFHAWGDPSGFPDPRQSARTIALCTENPGTQWFEGTYQLVPEYAAAVSINRSSAAELQRRGIQCEHLQLGYSPLWDSWLRNPSAERQIDVLYLGAADPRRDPLLGGLGKDLWARDCQFLIPPLEPRTNPRPDFLKGPEKYHRLCSAQVLLNLHRTTSSALEWMRFLEAICNGCVVVSEPCVDNEPLVPGEHYVAATADTIGPVVDRLLDDQEELRRVRERAYDFVREQLPMDPAGSRLTELALELPRHPPGRSGPSLLAEPRITPPTPVGPQVEAGRAEDAQRTDDAPPAHETWPRGANTSALEIKLRKAHGLLRAISDRAVRRPPRGIRILAKTLSYARTQPRVTVITVVANNIERGTVDALTSVAASHLGELELLILSVNSTRSLSNVLKGFLEDHPNLPAALLTQPIDRGLARSRNALIERSRGEYVFILDHQGGIYPSTLDRLASALDEDARAMFSYPMIAVFDGGRPVELLGSLPWEPERLKKGNWIDAMALVRRKGLLELGGYSTDPRLAGLEEFDLWCKCAESGGYGVQVPQVLAWHPRSPDSMPAHAERGEAWALMQARFPRLLGAPSRV